MGKVATSFVLFALIGGCAVNTYQTHYSGTTARSPEVIGRIVPAAGPARVTRGGNPKEDLVVMLESGFVLLGSSSFTGAVPPPRLLLKQAKSVGASHVILYERYKQTVSGTASLALPGPATAVQSGGGGAESTVGYHGAGTSSAQGGSAVREIPYSVKQYAQLATFWVQGKPAHVGIYYRPLTETERGALHRQTGLVVIAVVKGSPADEAHILRGDLLLRVNGADIQSPEEFKTYLGRESGLITFEILRDSRVHRITVTPLASP